MASHSANAKPISFKFHVEKVSDNLYSIRPEKYWRVNSMSVVYVGKNSLLLLDAQTDGTMALQMVAEIQPSIANLPIEYIVLTHPHLDHIGGLAALKQKFPQVKIIAQQALSDFINNNSEKERDFEVNQWLQPLANERRAALAKITDNAARQLAEHDVQELENYIADIHAVIFIHPDILFNKQLTLNFGDQFIQLNHAGPAHTPADTTVYFPRERVLATGDLFHNLDPLIWPEASPLGWINTLNYLITVDAHTYLGGHGDAIRDKQLLVFWRDYLSELVQRVKIAKAAGKTLTELKDSTNLKDIAALSNSSYATRIMEHSEKIMPFDDSMDAKLDRELDGLWNKF